MKFHKWVPLSVSRLNWAAPYNTHAWPPISRCRTWRVVRVERTLRIGFGIKRASHREVELPELHRLRPALLRRQAVPRFPFVVSQVVHAFILSKLCCSSQANPIQNALSIPTPASQR